MSDRGTTVNPSLTFLGATRNVTGSSYCLETDRARILIDCGLYQERDLRARNWVPFPVPPSSLDAVLLTHAHLDHCGLLPKLVREGFRGHVYCTAATAEITRIALLDAAHLQEEDVEFKRRRHERTGTQSPYPYLPLYTPSQAEAVFPLLKPARYEKPVEVADGIEAVFHEAGHILGSAAITVKVKRKDNEKTILFSGDIGRWDKPILRDPAPVAKADYVVMESTYGDSMHPDQEGMVQALADVVNSTRKAGGNLVIPAFAIERTQELLYYFDQLLLADRIPHLVVFVDSPMAVDVTDVFKHHPELFDAETLALIHSHKSPFDFPGLHLVRTIDESKAINHISGTVAVITGSGMCTGGRIKHHLITNIVRPESTILFVGYQAANTLGRQIVDGAREVRILGQTYPVRARIAQMNGFSAHADRDELLRWLRNLEGPPRHVFITHGEPEVSQHFDALVRERFGWDCSVPEYRDAVTLS